MPIKQRIALGALVMFFAPVGCSDNPTERPQDDAQITPHEASTGGLGISGVIKDALGVPVEGVEVEVSGETAYSTHEGVFTISGLTAGAATLTATQSWFNEHSQAVTVEATGMTNVEVTMEVKPLKLEAADKALAEEYLKTFDWTQDTLSIVIIPRPTRVALDNAIYWHNPAMFRDTSSTEALTPAPQPNINGGAENFTFPITSGDNKDQEAFEGATIADAIEDTPLTADEREQFMIWKPMMNWLKNWDSSQSATINAVGVAVARQVWGSNAIAPQEIEEVYFHGEEIWVKVVFENFVKLGSGVTDTDGDGRQEIFTKVAPTHVSADIIAKLKADYIAPTFDTHGLSKEINHSLTELYSTTSASVKGYIGEPFTVEGSGTVSYPFVVLEHSQGQINVLLVSP